jgi:hypothetical protein
MVKLRNRLRSGKDDKRWQNDPRWTLLDLVLGCWRFNATDQRDKVYALLGLLSFEKHCVPQEVYPDYTSATTYSSLIKSVTICALTRESCLKSLFYCKPGQRDVVPSWPCDIEKPTAAIMSYALCYKGLEYSAAGDSAPDICTHPMDGSALVFKITRIGVILKLTPPLAGALTQAEEDAKHEEILFVRFIYRSEIYLISSEPAGTWSKKDLVSCSRIGQQKIGQPSAEHSAATWILTADDFLPVQKLIAEISPPKSQYMGR